MRSAIAEKIIDELKSMLREVEQRKKEQNEQNFKTLSKERQNSTNQENKNGTD